jgi:hypothetical protein
MEPSPVATQLSARLRGLELAAIKANPAPTASSAAWDDASFLPAGGECEAQPSLTCVQVHRDREHWQLTFVERHVAFNATVGTGGWRTNLRETDHGRTGVPVAVSGGWTEQDMFRAEIIFLETPHRLELTCSLDTGTFQAGWRTVPLRPGHLTELRMPR